MKRIAGFGILATLLGISTAQAELPSGLRYDHGFAHFEADKEGSMSGGTVTHGYTLRTSARILGETVSRNDQIKFVYKQGGRELGSQVCRARLETSSGRQTLSVFTEKCRNESVHLSAEGTLEVEVYYVSDATDDEHLAHTHTIEVLRSTRFRGNGTEEPSDFLINRHDINRSTVVRSTSATETRVVATNRAESEHMRWATVQVLLPIVWGDEDPQGRLRLDEHEGTWECLLRDGDRENLLTFSFEVAGGTIQPHAEETAGLSLPPQVHLAESTFSAHPALGRTDPAKSSAAFYGRAWVSDEAQGMAGTLPTVGTPYLPSAAPRTAGRAGRRRGRR